MQSFVGYHIRMWNHAWFIFKRNKYIFCSTRHILSDHILKPCLDKRNHIWRKEQMIFYLSARDMVISNITPECHKKQWSLDSILQNLFMFHQNSNKHMISCPWVWQIWLASVCSVTSGLFSSFITAALYAVYSVLPAIKIVTAVMCVISCHIWANHKGTLMYVVFNYVLTRQDIISTWVHPLKSVRNDFMWGKGLI